MNWKQTWLNLLNSVFPRWSCRLVKLSSSVWLAAQYGNRMNGNRAKLCDTRVSHKYFSLKLLVFARSELLCLSCSPYSCEKWHSAFGTPSNCLLGFTGSLCCLLVFYKLNDISINFKKICLYYTPYLNKLCKFYPEIVKFEEIIKRAGFVGTYIAYRSQDLGDQSSLLCLLWKLP